jgi:two-component system, chemotaxis family, protein-glutamate methylesterase/glutaminase
MKDKIKVLVVDDSALVRQTLVSILSSDPEIEVVGSATDPYNAVEKIKSIVPDVITLDIEMPKMDGLTFLKKLMGQHPIPVVVISTLTEKGTDSALLALEYGAIEVIAKPKVNTKVALEESTISLCDIVKAAAKATVKKKNFSAVSAAMRPKLSADAVIEKNEVLSKVQATETIIAIGASTGGTEALREVLETFPADSPGIVIVQHMPEMFTSQFAKRLDGICKITVKEAKNGDKVIRGQALIAPGAKHMILKRSGAQYYVEVLDGPYVNRHRPSVDVLFRSAARYAGKNALGVILTGMGDDGAKGMLEMKETGAYTIAQDEESCVVFGMPKEAIKLGGVEKILPLNKITGHILMKVK